MKRKGNSATVIELVCWCVNRFGKLTGTLNTTTTTTIKTTERLQERKADRPDVHV